MDARMEGGSGSPPDIWKQVFDAMNEGCAICEIILDEGGRPRDYRHLHVNRAFEDLSGRFFSHGKILGRTARELIPGLEDNWVEFFGKVALKGEPATWTSYVKPLGRWMDTRAFNLGGGRFVYFLDDVTELHKIEEERAKFVHEKEEKIRQAQKMEAIGKLAGGVAHDFNNLLTAINGYCEMLLEITPKGDSRREFLQEIRESGQRAASLTTQLLAYSRKQVLRPQVLHLNTVVEEGARLLRRIIGESIEMRLRLDSNLLPVMADPNQMHQILFNLVLNARDAMPSGGVLTLSTRNTTLAERREGRHGTLAAGRYAVLEVADTGIGMSEDVQAQIFEPFFTTKEVGKAVGLGLSSVYGILQQSGGGIEVESRPGEGSAFRIHLPVLELEEKAKAAQDQEQPHSVPGRGRILVVEDEEAVRKFVRSHLESLGYSVVEARNGLEAMASLSSQDFEPDLLLTDVVMPRMGGARLAESVRILRPHLPILFMSGYAEEMLNMQAKGAEQIQYLQKPFSAGTLARKIEEMIRVEAPPAR